MITTLHKGLERGEGGGGHVNCLMYADYLAQNKLKVRTEAKSAQCARKW